ncbi:hypothetical protein [Deinococcus pimensis]|uniref:hypothetical protein n=1 Tax=Deinococcus pimensis TaxID=309888 RepID=UPI0004899153|nr:hypothetical protein [Deinococcus pimensis]
MGIAHTVSTLADVVLTASLPLTADHQLVLHLFRLMPQYLKYGDLSCWDRACMEVIGDDVSPQEQLIWSIFDFARTNLYTAHNADYTQDAWNDVLTEFDKHGLPAPPLLPGALDDW